MKSKKYFSSGEFAKLTGVNKRTLHYYNDIGLFKPRFIGENGYHYYSGNQFASLELILILRKVGLSIEEIQAYFSNTGPDSFREMMERKKQLIDDSIRQLLSIRTFLNKKSERIQLALQAKHGDVSLITLPERKIVLSDSIPGVGEEDDASIAAEFSLRLKQLFSLYDSFGSRISVNALRKEAFDCYDRYFAYCPALSKEYDQVIPAGTYLQAFCIGSWDKLPEVYLKIFQYAQEQSLELSGYAYEEGLNEMSLSHLDMEQIGSMEDYITRITIAAVQK